MVRYIFSVCLILMVSALAQEQYEKSYKYTQVENNKNSEGKEKTFIREYTYNASEDDSKNSSRKKATTQLKSLLSEEIGVHIQSSLDIKKTTSKGVDNKYIKKEISSLSAAITKMKILDEKWNGKTYYIKASVKINEEQTMKLLLEAIKAKASEKDVKRLNKILEEQNKDLDNSYSKIQELQKKLLKQEIENQASENELKETKQKLEELQRVKEKYDREVNAKKSEIEKIKSIIKDNEMNAYNSLMSGMTPNEVKKLIGNPRAINDCSDRMYYSYGRLWVMFTSGIVSGWVNVDEYQGPCLAYKGVISAKARKFPNG